MYLLIRIRSSSEECWINKFVPREKRLILLKFFAEFTNSATGCAFIICTHVCNHLMMKKEAILFRDRQSCREAPAPPSTSDLTHTEYARRLTWASYTQNEHNSCAYQVHAAWIAHRRARSQSQHYVSQNVDQNYYQTNYFPILIVANLYAITNYVNNNFLKLKQFRSEYLFTCIFVCEIMLITILRSSKSINQNICLLVFSFSKRFYITYFKYLCAGKRRVGTFFTISLSNQTHMLFTNKITNEIKKK